MDIYSLDGCLQAPFGVFPYGTSYQIPHHRIESHNPPKVGVYPHEWRAVGHTHTGIAYECFLDELAHLGGKDPLDVRLHLTKGHERMHALLKMLRQVSGWDEPMGAQKGRGVASRIYSVSPIANTVEVTVSDDGQSAVDRIVCVVDCGFAVNPLGIESSTSVRVKSGKDTFMTTTRSVFIKGRKLKPIPCPPMRLHPEWVNKPVRPSGPLWLTQFLRRPASECGNSRYHDMGLS